jgi:hypothetical protein
MAHEHEVLLIDRQAWAFWPQPRDHPQEPQAGILCDRRDLLDAISNECVRVGKVSNGDSWVFRKRMVKLVEGRARGPLPAIVIQQEHAEQALTPWFQDATAFMKIVAGLVGKQVSEQWGSVDDIEFLIGEGETIGRCRSAARGIIVRIVNIGPEELKGWLLALKACLSILNAYTVNIETGIPTRVSEITDEATRCPAMTTAQLKHGGFAPEVA